MIQYPYNMETPKKTYTSHIISGSQAGIVKSMLTQWKIMPIISKNTMTIISIPLLGKIIVLLLGIVIYNKNYANYF